MGDYEWERPREPEGRTRVGVSVSLPALDPSLWPRFKEYLLGRDLSPEVAIYNGWYPSSVAGDREPRVVIIGARTAGMFWQARAMLAPDTVYPTAQRAVTRYPPILRYQSPPGPRGDALIIVDPLPALVSATPVRPGVVLVEGPMCALADAGVGYRGVAIMGNFNGEPPAPPTLEHLIKAIRGHPVVIVGDLDSPAALAPTAAALAAKGGVRCRMVVCPRKDLADLPAPLRGTLLAGWFE